MRNIRLKIFILLFVLFLLDMTVHFDYLFKTDFLMVGIIFAAFYLDFSFALFYSVLFGLVKDALSINFLPFFTCGLVLTVVLIKAFLKHLSDKPIFDFLVVLVAVIFNLVFGAFMSGGVSLMFSFNFIIYSLFTFLLIKFILKEWIQE